VGRVVLRRATSLGSGEGDAGAELFVGVVDVGVRELEEVSMWFFG
jgi:hypothetical protein